MPTNSKAMLTISNAGVKLCASDKKIKNNRGRSRLSTPIDFFYLLWSCQKGLTAHFKLTPFTVIFAPQFYQPRVRKKSMRLQVKILRWWELFRLRNCGSDSNFTLNTIKIYLQMKRNFLLNDADVILLKIFCFVHFYKSNNLHKVKKTWLNNRKEK